MTQTAGGYGAVNDFFNWSDIVAGNRADLFGLTGQYDPFYIGAADATGTFKPTLAGQAQQDQVSQWGVDNVYRDRALDAQIAQMAQAGRLDEGSLTGFYNGLPTMERQRLATEVGIFNADNFRQWASMRGSQLLQARGQDDALRMAGAGAKLDTLGLLASMKGPENFMQYNWLENTLNSPELSATDPFQIANGLTAGLGERQPVDFNAAWNTAPGGGAVAAPAMAAPAQVVPPARQPTQANARRAAAVAPPSPSGIAISGNPQADAALKASSAWAGAPPEIQAEFERISGNMAGTYANAVAKNPDFKLYAEGTRGAGPSHQMPGGSMMPDSGMPGGAGSSGIDWTQYIGNGEFGFRNDAVFVVGEKGGMGSAEVIANPDGARFAVIPASALAPEDMAKVQSKMGPGMQQQASAPQPSIEGYAEGTSYDTNTPFGNFGTFTPTQLASSPLVKKLQGEMPTNLWQGFGGEDTMTLPGTNARLPMQFNVTDYLSGSPSSQAMTRSLYETPRSQGGLGLHWADIAQASQRAAPIGARTNWAGYGY